MRTHGMALLAMVAASACSLVVEAEDAEDALVVDDPGDTGADAGSPVQERVCPEFVPEQLEPELCFAQADADTGRLAIVAYFLGEAGAVHAAHAVVPVLAAEPGTREFTVGLSAAVFVGYERVREDAEGEDVFAREYVAPSGTLRVTSGADTMSMELDIVLEYAGSGADGSCSLEHRGTIQLGTCT